MEFGIWNLRLMIISIGTDIIEVYRIRETLERTLRFAERVFTEKEREYCESKGAASAQSYAARFAAKEAFSEGFADGLARENNLAGY